MYLAPLPCSWDGLTGGLNTEGEGLNTVLNNTDNLSPDVVRLCRDVLFFESIADLQPKNQNLYQKYLISRFSLINWISVGVRRRAKCEEILQFRLNIIKMSRKKETLQNDWINRVELAELRFVLNILSWNLDYLCLQRIPGWFHRIVLCFFQSKSWISN